MSAKGIEAPKDTGKLVLGVHPGSIVRLYTSDGPVTLRFELDPLRAHRLKMQAEAPLSVEIRRVR